MINIANGYTEKKQNKIKKTLLFNLCTPVGNINFLSFQ